MKYETQLFGGQTNLHCMKQIGLFSEIEQVVKGALLRHRHTAQLDVDGVVQLMIYRERV